MGIVNIRIMRIRNGDAEATHVVFPVSNVKLRAPVARSDTQICHVHSGTRAGHLVGRSPAASQLDLSRSIRSASACRRSGAHLAREIKSFAAVTVFFNKHAIVIGPTPPGTGVMAPAT